MTKHLKEGDLPKFGSPIIGGGTRSTAPSAYQKVTLTGVFTPSPRPRGMKKGSKPKKKSSQTAKPFNTMADQLKAIGVSMKLPCLANSWAQLPERKIRSFGKTVSVYTIPVQFKPKAAEEQIRPIEEVFDIKAREIPVLKTGEIPVHTVRDDITEIFEELNTYPDDQEFGAAADQAALEDQYKEEIELVMSMFC